MHRLLALNNYDLLSQNLTPTHPAPKQCLSYRHIGSLLFKDLLKPEINSTSSHLSKDGCFRSLWRCERENHPVIHSEAFYHAVFSFRCWPSLSAVNTSFWLRLCVLGTLFLCCTLQSLKYLKNICSWSELLYRSKCKSYGKPTSVISTELTKSFSIWCGELRPLEIKRLNTLWSSQFLIWMNSTFLKFDLH